MTEYNQNLPQSIGLIGVRNARELGGYKTQEGKKIRMGRLLRTERLAKASPEDLQRLTEVYGMTKVIDFRTSIERNREPDPMIPQVENFHLNVFGDKNRKGMMKSFIYGTQPPLDAMMTLELPLQALHADHQQEYRGFVTESLALQAYHDFFGAAISQEEGSISWHCQAGKDRAGVAAALMLLALGVEWPTVRQDYLLTNEYRRDSIEQFVAFTKEQTDREEIWQTAQAMAGVHASWIDAVEDEVRKRYGSYEIFFRDALQITDSDLRDLHRLYLTH